MTDMNFLHKCQYTPINCFHTHADRCMNKQFNYSAQQNKFSKYFDCALRKHNTGHVNMFLSTWPTNARMDTSPMCSKCTSWRNSLTQFQSCRAHVSTNFIQTGDITFFSLAEDKLVAHMQMQTPISNNRLTACNTAHYTTYGQVLSIKAFCNKLYQFVLKFLSMQAVIVVISLFYVHAGWKPLPLTSHPVLSKSICCHQISLPHPSI